MYNIEFFNLHLAIFASIGVIVLLILLSGKIVAPYGKLVSNVFGTWAIPARWGWILMEAPSSIIFFIFLFATENLNSGQIALFLVWQFHYFYRSFIYPFMTKHKKSMPLGIMLGALMFQIANTYFQTGWIFVVSPNDYSGDYLTSWYFITGLIVFLLGSFINRQADLILKNLRKDGSMDYKIPYGALYKYVSCPNYLGEMLIWLGWAIMLKSWVGFVFFLWTVSNLLPRALASHKWYLKTFPEYPKDRKAVVPFVL